MFVQFSKNLGKIFILICSLTFVLILKSKLLGVGATAFTMALFAVVATVLISVISITDTYILSNILMGLGLGLGMSVFSPVSGGAVA
jgi:prepilin signal peptidase PulO-like enzyme (type II secretory pathway)